METNHADHDHVVYEPPLTQAELRNVRRLIEERASRGFMDSFVAGPIVNPQVDSPCSAPETDDGSLPDV